jgi:hypothetical protein
MNFISLKMWGNGQLIVRIRTNQWGCSYPLKVVVWSKSPSPRATLDVGQTDSQFWS